MTSFIVTNLLWSHSRPKTGHEFPLTYYLYIRRSVILSKRAFNTACVLCAVFNFCPFDNETVVIHDWKLAPLNDLCAIFLPGNKWCWYSTNWTLDGDGSVWSCCHVITNFHSHWTAITNGNNLSYFRHLNHWIYRFCVYKRLSLRASCYFLCGIQKR